MDDFGGANALATAPRQKIWQYPDALNLDLLDRIPLDAATVLDVGCGTGALGAAYKRLNPNARVLGIEANAAAARVAARRIDQVAVADIETGVLPFDLPQGIDCLVYGDVLEHLRDPWEVLSRHVHLLAPGGMLLACIPNVEHWSFAARLMQGHWDYAETGLLDRTHLRWFTRQTAERALIEAGLVIVDRLSRVFDADLATGFVAAIKPALAALGADAQDYESRAIPLQYVWRARWQKPEALTIVSTMLAPVGGVSQVRVLDPLRCLSSQPGVVTLVSNGRELPSIDHDVAKIFVFHRPALTGPSALRTIGALVARNYVIVTEFDDHPDYIPVLQRDDMYNFRAVHAVQTTTEALAEVLRRDNDEVMIFPNGIHMLPEIRNYSQKSRLSLFFGGLNRQGDWSPYIEALNAVAEKVGGRLHFSIVHDSALFEALRTPHKNFVPTLDYASYLHLLSQSELSFMPLSDTPFNRTKSDLKFIEAAACRVTALASPVVYADTIEDGRTGILFRDPLELQSRLLELIANFDLSRSIGDSARAWVASRRMLAYQTTARLAWYRSLWERRAELTDALLSRMPQLARYRS